MSKQRRSTSSTSTASRLPRASQPKPPFTGLDANRSAAMLDSVRRQTGAVLSPDAAPIPPGVDQPSDSGISKSVVPAGAGTKGGMGSGFGFA